MFSFRGALLAFGLLILSLCSSWAGETCPSSLIQTGLVTLLSETSRLTLFAGRYLRIEDDRRNDVFDLQDAQAPLVGPTSLPPFQKMGRQIFSAKPQRLQLANGSVLEISSLHGAVSILRMGAHDPKAFAAFAQELEQGRACHRPFRDLNDETITTLRPIVHFYLWDLLARGQLDSVQAWEDRRDILRIFTTKEVREDLFNIYSYRIVHQAAAIRALKQIDPYRLWMFALRPLYLMFDGKPEDQLLTDLSIDQDGDQFHINILANHSFQGANFIAPYHIWVKHLASKKISRFSDFDENYTWNLGESLFRARVNLHAFAPEKPRMRSFPKNFKNGLIIIDANFDKDEVGEVVNDYLARLSAADFIFDPPQVSNRAIQMIEQQFLDHQPDWLFRDGHAEFSPNFVFSLAKEGFVQHATRMRKGIEQHVVLFYPDVAKMSDDPDVSDVQVPIEIFRQWAAPYARRAAPLVMVDNGCWSLHHAKSLFSGLDAKDLVYVAARQTVNFINKADVTAGSLLLSALLRGESFPSLRHRLAHLKSQAKGEDHFIFPDELAHPTRTWRVSVRRLLQHSDGKGEWKAYAPE